MIQRSPQFLLVMLLWCLASISSAHLPLDFSIAAPKPMKEWRTLETEHFRINFQEEHLAFAQRMAAIAENVYEKTTAWMDWHPEDITEIIINDAFDGSNGGATPLPYNRFFIFMNAPVDGELIDNSPWLELVFTHEFIHILHLDQASGLPSGLRSVFGRIFFTFPQIFSPKWITEGLAVYGETDHQDGYGRGQGAVYRGMMQAEVMTGLRSLTEMSYHGYQGTDWPLGQVYLYGYYFMEFVEAEFGKDKLNAYIKNWNDNIIPWRLEARARQVFGLTATQLWSRFQNYLRNKFEPQLAHIERRGLQPSQAIAEAGMLNTNPVWLPSGEMFYYHYSGYEHARINRVSADGDISLVAEVEGFSMFDVHPDKGVLLSRAEICDNTNVYTDLYQLAPGESKWRRLTECGRYPRAFWSPDGRYIVAVKVGNGQTSLVLLDREGVELTLLDVRGLGETIGHFDWSADGKTIVAAIKHEVSGWNLEQYDLFKREWTALTRNAHIEYRPRYSADGKSIYFISDQGNALNVRQLDLATGQVSTLTNTKTAIMDYAVNPAGDALRVVEYTANGFAINEITLQNRYDTYAAKAVDSPPVVSFSNSPGYHPEQYTDVVDYSPWRSLRPRAWWAWLLADGSDNSSIQFIVDGNDALNFHYWQVAPQWFFDKERWGGELAYMFYNRFALLASRKVDLQREEDEALNQYEIWDLEDRYQFVYTQPFNSLENRWRFHAGVAKENVERTFEETGATSYAENNLVGLLLNLNNTSQYLHSISAEDGRDVTLTLEKYNALGDGNSTGLVKIFDWREFVSFSENQVLALRFLWADSGNDDRAKRLEVGGNYDGFGTLGANIGFGVDEFMLRGYSKDSPLLAGTRVNLNSLEWRFPVVEVFDGWRVPPVGLGKTSMSLFVDSGAAWSKGESAKYYSSVGFEISPDLLIGYDTFYLDINVGVAYGLDRDVGQTEAYLRLISSF